MRSITTFGMLTLSLASYAQTFTGGSGPILDNQTLDIPIVISGIANLDTINFGLETVCINATHTYDADVSFWIIAPDGTVAPLFANVGGGDDNFTNTCLNQDAITQIGQGTAPFTGTFKPSGQMGLVNNGQSGNGTWYLRVSDNYGADEGIVSSFTLTFGNNPATYFAFTSSLLPIVRINTGGNTIVDNTKISATMGIVENGAGNRNYMTDPSNHFAGNIGIAYRGNYSLSLPQKPFVLETQDALNVPMDTSILGLPSEHDWLLLANYNDKSFARNVLPYHLFDSMGHYATRSRFVDVVVNGEYQGIYLFCEKIKRDAKRVNISKLDSSEISGVNVTGGYIIKVDYWDNTNSWPSNYTPIGFPTADVHFVYVYPTVTNIQPEQQTYIQNYVNDFETALYGSNFQDPATGYRAFIGVGSFVDYFIISELTRNVDGYKKSRYFSKDKDAASGTVRKLKAGPVWDFDWSQKDMWGGSEDGSGWMYENPDQDVNAPGWYIRLLQDTLFANELRCRYDDLRRNILSQAYINAKIDSVASVVNESQAWHYQIWGHLGSATGTPETGTPSASYAEEVQRLKDWYGRRLTWLDLNMPGTLNGCSFANLQQLVELKQIVAYPVPFTENITLEWSKGDLCGAEVSVLDQQGRVISETIIKVDNEKSYTLNGLSNLKSGCYFVRISKGYEIVSLKVLK